MTYSKLINHGGKPIVRGQTTGYYGYGSHNFFYFRPLFLQLLLLTGTCATRYLTQSILGSGWMLVVPARKTRDAPQISLSYQVAWNSKPIQSVLLRELELLSHKY